MLEGILNVFRALLAPVIAGVVAYIAYQQHKTNRDKLRLDLYNKRYEVFHSLMTLHAHILQQGSVKVEQVTECSRATKEAVFLFDEDISTYLETIRKKALDLWCAEETMRPLPVGNERSAKAAEVSELCRWFSKQSNVAVDKFGKYLKFEQKLEGKAMNWKKGFKRIAWVLSIVGFLFWVGFFIIALFEEGWDPVILEVGALFGILSFIGVWVVYYAGLYIGLYIVKGFCYAQPVD